MKWGTENGILVLPPDARAGDFFLVLSYVPGEPADPERTSVVLLGGFHDAGPPDDPAAAVGAIAVHYADGGDWDDLVNRVGSIDLARRPVPDRPNSITVSGIAALPSTP